jgi:hypothetical protein
LKDFNRELEVAPNIRVILTTHCVTSEQYKHEGPLRLDRSSKEPEVPLLLIYPSLHSVKFEVDEVAKGNSMDVVQNHIVMLMG